MPVPGGELGGLSVIRLTLRSNPPNPQSGGAVTSPEGGSHERFLPAFALYQGRADTNQQIVFVEWLSQVANDAGTQRARPNVVVRVSGDQDRRNGAA